MSETTQSQYRVCKRGNFCFLSLLCKVLGVKYDDQCMKCFAAHDIVVSNEGRRP